MNDDYGYEEYQKTSDILSFDFASLYPNTMKAIDVNQAIHKLERELDPYINTIEDLYD